MTLTPEQFNKLVTKEEFNSLEKRVENMDLKMDRLLEAVEVIATKHQVFELELISNRAAHERFE